MRIPTHGISDSLAMRFQQLATQQARLQDQISTGQRISRPSDDPAAVGRVLRLQTEQQQLSQYSRNNNRALEISQTSFEAVRGLKQVSDRVGELAVLGTGATGPDAYRAYAAEADQLLEHALQTANTQFAGEYLLGGTRTDAPPFEAVRDASGKVTAISYVGAANTADFRISEGTKISPYVDGTDNAKVADFLNRLVSVRDSLGAQDTAAVQATRAGLGNSEDDLLVTLSDIGATQTRLEADRSQNEARFAQLEDLSGRETDANISDTVVRLSQTQAAYQAALQSGAKVLQMSILDYVR